ncbi:hypothetical protein Tco_0132161 [Tanacetum coccineum]
MTRNCPTNATVNIYHSQTRLDMRSGDEEIEQYFQVQDYALWDVIENGNSFKPTVQSIANADGTSTTMIPGPITTEEKAQKKKDNMAFVSSPGSTNEVNTANVQVSTANSPVSTANSPVSTADTQ